MHRSVSIGLALAMAAGAFVMGGCSDAPDRLKATDSKVVIEAIREVAAWNNAEAVRVLTEFVSKQGDEMLAIQAVRSLGLMLRDDSLVTLADIAKTDKRAAVRQEAVAAIGHSRDDKYAGLLRELVTADPDPRVRAAAIGAMLRYKRLADVAFFVDVADKDQDDLVQAQAMGAVEKLLTMNFGYDRTASAAKRRAIIDSLLERITPAGSATPLPRHVYLAECVARIQKGEFTKTSK
jgi:HEAT repeat protein